MTRAYWERQGWRVAFVERYVEQKFGDRKFKRKFDAWGFADHLAFMPGRPGILALQSTDWTSFSKHLRKILCLAIAEEFLSIEGNRICVMGWKRNKIRNKPALRKTEWVTLEHFGQMRRCQPIRFLTWECDPSSLSCELKYKKRRVERNEPCTPKP